MSISANFPNVRPSLLLDFAQSQQLDPRVTFSRSTTAPYYDGKTSALAEQNLLLQSQNFATTWSNSGVASISTTATTAPDGTSTGNSITEDTSTGVHRFNQTVTTLASTSYVFSIYLKYSNCQYVSLINSPVNNSATFDLVNGTVTTSSGTLSNFITNVGNGWYRVGYVVNNLNAGSTQFFVQMMDSTGTTNNYTGTSRLIYTWGAQLEQRSSVTAYTPTTTTAITNYIPQLLTAPINAPRFDFNPTTGESLGLLIEQSSTNLVLWSQDFSNAAWAKANATVTTTAGIAPDGTQTAQLLVENSSYGSHGVSQAITVTSSQSYTQTIYAKAKDRTWIVMQPANNIPNCLAYFNLGTGAIGTLTNCTATITSVGNGWYKCSATFTNANSTQTQGVYLATGDGGATYTGNGYSGVYIWGMQFENLAFPTSYIPTTSAQVTRAVDNALMTGTNFSSWYNQGQGTWFVQARYNSQSFVSLLRGDGNMEWLGLYNNSSVLSTYNGTSLLLGLTSNTLANNKYAMTYTSNSRSLVGNGGTVTSDSNNAVGTTNNLFIGSGGGILANALNGWISKLMYYPQAITSAQLQALTGS